MSSRRHGGSLEQDAERNKAAWEATKGAVWGSTKWGAFFALAGGVAYTISPFYRGLTVPFKTYIQMSGMIVGGYLEAENRMGVYGQYMRSQKRLQRDMEAWKRYEESYEASGTPGVGAESRLSRENGK